MKPQKGTKGAKDRDQRSEVGDQSAEDGCRRMEGRKGTEI